MCIIKIFNNLECEFNNYKFIYVNDHVLERKQFKEWFPNILNNYSQWLKDYKQFIYIIKTKQISPQYLHLKLSMYNRYTPDKLTREEFKLIQKFLKEVSYE